MYREPRFNATRFLLSIKSLHPDSSTTIALQRTDWSLFGYRLGSLAAAEPNRYAPSSIDCGS
ncbi:hypothetical protein I8751_15075 [Nostocaceae cyanobacterium CENA357]|uniref:Uncharacterized protein n=1 Tax=Atlanticothrix silvestris CENA357 TaxID=1725252 RepID=A0A8J7HIT5_9CYAN|nr:hypothetical protein [Atlanticothrix silvestris]MBH8553669.1 hypothetical protein [Atlanticothrix silvestris CENA357]